MGENMKITDYIIELRGIHLYAHHGVMEQERAVGAWFTVDLRLSIADVSCAPADDIADTVSYADVYEAVKAEMAVPSDLLENVCYRIIKRVMADFSTVLAVDVTLTKDTPPLGGDRLSAAVTLKGRR